MSILTTECGEPAVLITEPDGTKELYSYSAAKDFGLPWPANVSNVMFRTNRGLVIVGE